MTRRFTIGRDRQCDVPLLDDSVSRRHAEIWVADDGTLMIADLRSSNGTRLIRNGASSVVNESAVLPGDKVRFGVVKVDVGALVDAVENANPGALTPVRIARIRCMCGVLKSPGEVCPGCGMTCGGSNG